MFKTLEYLKFLLSSTNQHGVHSPFVYNYVTQCIYARSPYRHPKKVSILLKSISYFEVKTIGFLTKNETMEKLVRSQFQGIRINAERKDAVYLDISDFGPDPSFESLNIHNHSIGFVDSIYQSGTHKNIWEELKRSPHITVTVDLFHLGIVFFRKEQAREHFKIRN